MKRVNCGYFISEGFRSIFTHGFMSFVAACIIVACLIIMGSFSLLAVNIDYNLTRFESENEFLAYIDESLSEEDARGLQSTLEGLYNVRAVTFVTREEAKQAYLDQQEDSELYADLPDDVFRHRFSIQVDDIEKMDDTVELVRMVSGVADISVDLDIADGFVVARNVISGISVIMIAVLFVVSIFIVYNTIRLATFSRRDEIAIMRMCGATSSFISWPFVVEGLIIGVFGGFVAFLLQWLVYALIANAASDPSASYQLLKIIPFGQICLPLLGVFIGTGFVIGVGGSLLSIRKFLEV